MYFLAVVSIVATTCILVFSFYNLFEIQVKNELKSKAVFFERSLNFLKDKTPYLNALGLYDIGIRLSILDVDKNIIFDTYTDKEREDIKSYIDNPAINSAIRDGEGEYKHFSKTFHGEIYYYALELQDGTIICLSQNTDGIYSVFINILPIIVLIAIFIFVLCNFLAVRFIKERARAEKMRREFSANVSHELKTPLTVIFGYADMMNNGMVKEKDIKDSVEKIKNESSRIINLIEDIIRLSEWDEEVASGETEKFNLQEIAEEVIDTLKLLAEEKKVNVKLINVGTGNNKINANKRMIYEVIFNLVENAIKYNKMNGNVEVKLLYEKGKHIIEVSDNGIGIPKKYHDRVFERFYRVDKSRSKKTGGTGLGLSIVKHIVQYHKGNMKLESEEGIGTRIVIKL